MWKIELEWIQSQKKSKLPPHFPLQSTILFPKPNDSVFPVLLMFSLFPANCLEQCSPAFFHFAALKDNYCGAHWLDGGGYSTSWQRFQGLGHCYSRSCCHWKGWYLGTSVTHLWHTSWEVLFQNSSATCVPLVGSLLHWRYSSSINQMWVVM